MLPVRYSDSRKAKGKALFIYAKFQDGANQKNKVHDGGRKTKRRFENLIMPSKRKSGNIRL